jgi:hypothetical protein
MLIGIQGLARPELLVEIEVCRRHYGRDTNVWRRS